MSKSRTKSMKRTEYLRAVPATDQQLGDAIRELIEFHNLRSRRWQQPIPVWLGLVLVDMNEHFLVLLTEYRRIRAENIALRYEVKHKSYLCRRRLQPIVRLLLK